MARKVLSNEEPPACIVCSARMDGQRWEGGLICSATCSDIWLMAAHGPEYDVDPEEQLYR